MWVCATTSAADKEKKTDIVQVTYTMFGPVVDIGGTAMVTWTMRITFVALLSLHLSLMLRLHSACLRHLSSSSLLNPFVDFTLFETPQMSKNSLEISLSLSFSLHGSV